MNCTVCDKEITAASFTLADGGTVCKDCLLAPRAESKFRNLRTEYGGEMFASRVEALRAAELDLLKKAGAILNYRRQPTYYLGSKINLYRADFFVVDDHGLPHAEDVKGFETAKFRRDKRLWVEFGPALPLVILKRSGSQWKREVIWPKVIHAERQAKYRQDMLDRKE